MDHCFFEMRADLEHAAEARQVRASSKALQMNDFSADELGAVWHPSVLLDGSAPSGHFRMRNQAAMIKGSPLARGRGLKHPHIRPQEHP